MNEDALDAMIYAWRVMKEKEEKTIMEGIFMGKIVGSCSRISEEDGKRCASIYFHDTESNVCSKLSHYNKTYSLVLSDDVIKTNDDLAEYWDNTCKDLVATGEKVGVKIEFKGDKSDSNVGDFDIINKKAIELMVKVSDTKHGYNKKWQAMLDALKAKGVEVIYMGEEDEKPCVDVKVPEIDILKKELEALKSRTLDNVEIRLSCGDIVWPYCDGFVHVSSMFDGVISADQITNGHINCLCKNYFDAESISHGTVPKCSSCSHFMHNPSRFAHDWCYMPISKEGGAGYIRKLNKEEAEGPACSDFKARKE